MLQHHNSMADTKVLWGRQDSEMDFRFEDHFDWIKGLGCGSFSEVYEVKHKFKDERSAIKKSKREFKSRSERAAYLREVQLANNIESHANVVEYYRAWQEACFFYVQMELCDGTLRHLMQRDGEILRSPPAETRIWKMVLQIARGLAHIHNYEVLHCDLKPDNILHSMETTFKIGDLGQATALKSWDEHEGDACYLSRDLLEKKPSPAADIFSFGIMLYELKSGEALPGHGDQWEVLRNGGVPAPAGCGSTLASLISRMMDPHPEARDSAATIVETCCAAFEEIAMAAAMAVCL